MKTERINIYLDKDLKAKALELQKKYKISLSAIADKVIFILFKHLKDEKYYKFYIYEKLRRSKTKTTIKPKCLSGVFNGITTNQKTKLATNFLEMYLKKDIANHTENSNKIYSEIDNELRKTTDIFYNYNAQIRQQRRLLNENRDYFIRALGVKADVREN